MARCLNAWVMSKLFKVVCMCASGRVCRPSHAWLGSFMK